MPIIRTRDTTKNFTIVSNELLRKPQLDLQTTGLLVYLLSHKDDWIVTNVHIGKVWGISPNTVTRMMRKLEDAGYLKKRNEKVQSNGWDYLLADTPFDFGFEETIPLNNCDDIPLNNCDDTPLNNCELRSTTSNTNSNTKKNKKKNAVPLGDAALQYPKGCNPSAWEKWIRYRSAGRPISNQVLNNCKKQFRELKKAGLKSWGKAIDVAMGEKWNSINPTYTKIKRIIKEDQATESVFEGVL